MARVSNVYIIKSACGRIKIGYAEDPHKRARDLQVGNPDELTVEFSVATAYHRSVESACHKALEPLRVRGEWFDASVEQAKTVLNTALEFERKSRLPFHPGDLVVCVDDFSHLGPDMGPAPEPWRCYEVVGVQEVTGGIYVNGMDRENIFLNPACFRKILPEDVVKLRDITTPRGKICPSEYEWSPVAKANDSEEY